MPRQARLDAPGTLHHVMARGIERRKIFLAEADFEDFVGRLEAVAGCTGVRVFAWALLPNHFHLLLQTGAVSLSTVMRRVMTGYAGAFNRRHRRHGHLFQNRYKSIVCEREVYLLELVRYIHLNPLRARVVSSLEELTSYPYAGHATLLGKGNRAWQATEEVLNRFGDTVGEARTRYEQFVQAGADQGRRPELVGGGLHRSAGAWLDLPTRKGQREAVVHDERVLGGSEFGADLLADADWERRQLLKARMRASIGELAGHVARLADISIEDLRGGGKRRRVVQARAALAQVAIVEFGHTGAALARYLGVAPSTVNRQAIEGELSPLAKSVLEALPS